jgi:hypothetical protein
MATVGSTSAPSTNTVYYDALLSTTLNAYRKTLYDNIFKDSAFLAYMRMSDAIRKQDGGERIQVPLMYGGNSTVKHFDRVKPCELLENPYGAISIQAQQWEGSTTIPQGSTHKCVEAQGAHVVMSDDIVSSAWQHAAASAV